MFKLSWAFKGGLCLFVFVEVFHFVLLLLFLPFLASL